MKPLASFHMSAISLWPFLSIVLKRNFLHLTKQSKVSLEFCSLTFFTSDSLTENGLENYYKCNRNSNVCKNNQPYKNLASIGPLSLLITCREAGKRVWYAEVNECYTSILELKYFFLADFLFAFFFPVTSIEMWKTQ